MTNYLLEPELPKGDVVAGDASGRAKDKVLIGRLAEAGPARRLYLDISGEQVVAILGKRGTGKSYSLGVLIEGLAAGEGVTQVAELHTQRGGLVFDLMDIFWTSTLPLQPGMSEEISKQYERMKSAGLKAAPVNVDVWVPAGFARPEIDPPNMHEFRMQASDLELDDWADLFGVDIYSEPRGMLISDLLTYVGRDGYRTLSGTNAPGKKDFTFSDLINCLDGDPRIETNFTEATRRSVRQRLNTYSTLSLFNGQGTPIKDVITPFHVSVLMLGRVSDELKKVLVSVLLKRILRDRRDVSFAQKRLELDHRIADNERERLGKVVRSGIPRTWVFLDEAHILAGTQASVAGEALVKYAKEGRNYGLSLALATQQPTALDPRLTSQAETLVVHQLTSPSDAGTATQAIRSPLPASVHLDGHASTVEAMLRRLGQGEAIFSTANAANLPRLCVVKVRARITAHGGYEA